MSRYALVYCTMICASMGISIDGHTRMDAVTDLLHGKVAKIVRILSNLIPAVGCFYLCYWAYIHVIKMMMVGTMTTGLKIPLWTCYLIMPLGMAGMAIRSLVLVIQDICKFNVPDAPKASEMDEIPTIQAEQEG